MYIKILELKNYDILDSAIDGEEAVLKFQSFQVKPDVILMDHRMPNKNGLDAAREILEMDHNVRIIFASADHSIRPIIKALGVKCFLEKPFPLSRLIEEIENCLSLQPFP